MLNIMLIENEELILIGKKYIFINKFHLLNMLITNTFIFIKCYQVPSLASYTFPVGLVNIL